MADLVFRGTREELLERLAQLPAALAGRVPEHADAARAVARAIGIEAAGCVKDDFIDKSRGGTGSDGVAWKPLSPKTIAYGRRHPGLAAKRKRADAKGRASRPLLTDRQDKLWRRVYATCLRRGDDPRTAAMKAWGVVKAAGGRTIIGQYGGAQVDIGRDTGRLLASLSPGGTDNVLEPEPGSVRIASNVKYAPFFFAQRPIVPTSLPDRWRERLTDVLQAALPGFIQAVVGG